MKKEIDKRTGRPVGDHGKTIDAIRFAIDVLSYEEIEFIRSWYSGDLDEWPEYYKYLRIIESKKSEEEKMSLVQSLKRELRF